MPRYYFDFDHPEHYSIDEEGTELADIPAAQVEAAQAAAEWLKDNATVDAEISVQVRDDASRPLFAVTAFFQLQAHTNSSDTE
jgi:hypothetical protein